MLLRLIAAARPRPSAVLQERLADVLSTVSRHKAGNVRVFGSVARGDDTYDSDVDLLVTFGDDATILDQSRIVIDLQDLLGCDVDVVSDATLGRRAASILSDAVPLA
jgi:predicted nucleotidyltransferase